MSYTVRDATSEGDFRWLVRQLPEFADYHGEQQWLPHWSRMYEQLFNAARTGYLKLCVEGDDVGQPVRAGFLMALLHPHWSNPAITQASEMLWWVIPEYRSTRAGLMLIDDFTAWGKENADCISFSLVGPAGDRALQRRGYKFGERVYTRETGRAKNS